MPSIDESILSFAVMVGDHAYTVQELVGIDPEGLSAEFSTHSARLAYLGVLMAQAEDAYNVAKDELELQKANADLYYREQFKDKKPTEAAIAALVQCDEQCAAARAKLRQAEVHFKKLKAVVEAMRVRGDMLISLGAQMRSEMAMTGMAINEAVEAKITRLREQRKAGAG